MLLPFLASLSCHVECPEGTHLYQNMVQRAALTLGGKGGCCSIRSGRCGWCPAQPGLSSCLPGDICPCACPATTIPSSSPAVPEVQAAAWAEASSLCGSSALLRHNLAVKTTAHYLVNFQKLMFLE